MASARALAPWLRPLLLPSFGLFSAMLLLGVPWDAAGLTPSDLRLPAADGTLWQGWRCAVQLSLVPQTVLWTGLAPVRGPSGFHPVATPPHGLPWAALSVAAGLVGGAHGDPHVRAVNSVPYRACGRRRPWTMAVGTTGGRPRNQRC